MKLSYAIVSATTVQELSNAVNALMGTDGSWVPLGGVTTGDEFQEKTNEDGEKITVHMKFFQGMVRKAGLIATPQG